MLYGEIIRQHLKIINEHVVADTIDYLEMKFTFQTDDWDGLEKWAHFSKNGTVYDIRLTDDGIRKEDHLNLSAGVWKVYLHGNEFADGKVIERITTCVENLRVYPTGTLDGEPFPEMPASVTEQILARLDNVEQNGGGGGAGGLAPVDKTDAMTAEVGRDEDGRLWTAGTGRGVHSFGLGFARGPDGFGEFPALNIVLEDEQGFSVLLKDIAEQIEPDLSDGLPEHTAEDNNKILRIVDGDAAWTEDSVYVLGEGESADDAPDAEVVFDVWSEDGDAGETVATEVYMRVSGGYIQYSTDNATWKNVIAVADLKGDKGDKGDPGQDGEDGQDGANGKDGVSATHSWNGTVLTVTSASGTSSADLKGDKGDKGDPGYTPVKGTDYYTDADKTEIVNAVLDALPTWEGGNF